MKLDQYIEGTPGAYYFCIELIWGRQISGGCFYYKRDAIACLERKLHEFLDAPELVLYTKPRKRA